ncbi:MAG: hypothetical protein J7501_07140 [Bdellovibrio sp.]|nr:hypothetical protein [Bdellovibrio sp.]
MNYISQGMKKTSVQIFFTITSSLLIAPAAFAVDTSACYTKEIAISDRAKCVEELKKAASDDDKKGDCSDLQKTIADAKSDRAKACKSAGVGTDCEDRVEACTQAASESGYNTTAALLNAAGVSSEITNVIGGAGKSQSSGCPQYTAQDFATKKDKYTDALDKAEDDLAKLTDDKADAEEDFNKEINDLQEDLNKAQEDLDKKKNEISDKKREQIAEMQKQQNEAKSAMRDNETKILQLRGQLISTQRKFAKDMIGLTENMTTLQCKAKLEDAKSKMSSSGYTGTGKLFQKNQSKKDILLATWKACIDEYQQQRAALTETQNQQLKEIQDQINRAEEDKATTQDTINLAQSQLTEAQTQAANEVSQAEQSLLKLMQNTQNKMTAAKQKLDTKLQKIAQRTTDLTEKINRLNNQLATLGAEPRSGATATAADISEELASYEETRATAVAAAKELGCGFAKKLSTSGAIK